VAIATEYNKAMLVVENANIGWSTIQTIIEKNYENLYYSPKSDAPDVNSYLKSYSRSSNMTAGFTMSSRTRPMVIGKFQEYVGDKGVTIRSKRLIEEMKTFIWKYGRAEAQGGYNDDLVMSFGIGLYVRDTALKFRQHGVDITKAALNSMTTNSTPYKGAYFSTGQDNPYHMDNGKGGTEDFSWIL
jgi:hypothetical protein